MRFFHSGCFPTNFLACCILAEGLGSGPVFAQGVSLRQDPKLQGAITLVLRNPSAQEFAFSMQKAAGIALELAPDLNAAPERFGNFTFSRVPAWKVLEDVAATQMVNGRWEATENGYRLVGQIKAGPSAAPPFLPRPLVTPDEASSGLLPIIICGAVVAMASLALVYRAWKRKNSSLTRA